LLLASQFLLLSQKEPTWTCCSSLFSSCWLLRNEVSIPSIPPVQLITPSTKCLELPKPWLFVVRVGL
jgi:hypothetical protein